MRSAQTTDCMCPTVRIYRLHTQLTVPEPEIIYTLDTPGADGHGHREVLLVVCSIADEREVALALQLAKSCSSSAITAAVIKDDLNQERGDKEGRSRDLRLNELRRTFNCVLFVNECVAEDVVKRLAHALITPGNAGQPACCDWNDLRSIVDSDNRFQSSTYGFGRGFGDERASLSAGAALLNFREKNFGAVDVSGVIVSIVSAPESLSGRQLNEISRTIRLEFAPAASIAIGVRYDDALADDSIEVDVFAFRR